MLKAVVPLFVLTVVVAFAAVVFSLDALSAARNDREAPAVAVSHDHNVALPLESFAGAVPQNAAELAKAHEPYDASLPPLQHGDVVKVHMVMKDRTVEIAPGVKYNVWAFDGDYSAPGPIVHVREGQTVEFTLTNGAIPHSMDFHAARICSERGFQGRPARRVVHLPLQGE